MAGKWEPFDINGSVFRPVAKLLYVEEPDFGCEDVPEDTAVYGSIVLEDKHGQRTVKIEEELLFASRLHDGMWVGKLARSMVLLGKDKKTVYQPNEAERKWLETIFSACRKNTD
ncbi:MAG: hypothetical protein Q4C40_05815 [Eubacteriales bacterium]|nr:hypothetical protein [Eubacteriales bacterium]